MHEISTVAHPGVHEARNVLCARIVPPSGYTWPYDQPCTSTYHLTEAVTGDCLGHGLAIAAGLVAEAPLACSPAAGSDERSCHPAENSEILLLQSSR